jgi:hypothetical protein
LLLLAEGGEEQEVAVAKAAVACKDLQAVARVAICNKAVGKTVTGLLHLPLHPAVVKAICKAGICLKTVHNNINIK